MLITIMLRSIGREIHRIRIGIIRKCSMRIMTRFILLGLSMLRRGISREIRLPGLRKLFLRGGFHRLLGLRNGHRELWMPTSSAFSILLELNCHRVWLTVHLSLESRRKTLRLSSGMSQSGLQESSCKKRDSWQKKVLFRTNTLNNG